MCYDEVYVYQPWGRKTQPASQTCDSCHVDRELHYTNVWSFDGMGMPFMYGCADNSASPLQGSIPLSTGRGISNISLKMICVTAQGSCPLSAVCI
jgi:hypothetical protein